jgi:5'-nucleotidase (lipoprotein e(P4) family)
MKRAVALAALLAGACVSQPSAVESAPPPAVAAESEPRVHNGDYWLYGSAEGSVATRQAFKALIDYTVATAHNRPQSSVILDPASSPTGSAPASFAPCGNKPLAAVFDADETLIWNIPPRRDNVLHNDSKFDVATWMSWEKTGAGHAIAIPGAAEALAALRAAGITPIANTNRTAANADQTAATLKAAGLGDFVHGQTLFLSGDDTLKGNKDGRRATIASRYCVIVMAGDQLGDFSNAFNDTALSPAQRRAAAISGPASALWGRGWFLLPNPSYGPWDSKLEFDDVYGTDPWVPSKGEE